MREQLIHSRSLPSRERGLKLVDSGVTPWPWKSLPSRERGLKCDTPYGQGSMTWSLPSRERGLKLIVCPVYSLLPGSLPSRERGLKCQNLLYLGSSIIVAPFTGAWIEIWLLSASLSTAPCRSLHGSVD